ncbi:MAG: hypothetical protein GEV03_25385 [Streptosporangiales bacterium]|nr:hypothetical protein [Streptosporangiales bacterium]
MSRTDVSPLAEGDSYTMVGSGFEETRRAEAVRQMADRRVEVPIDGGFGAVLVDGYGDLVDVQIDRQAVRYTEPARLAPKILQAIQEAQQKANAAANGGATYG